MYNANFFTSQAEKHKTKDIEKRRHLARLTTKERQLEITLLLEKVFCIKRMILVRYRDVLK